MRPGNEAAKLMHSLGFNVYKVRPKINYELIYELDRKPDFDKHLYITENERDARDKNSPSNIIKRLGDIDGD